MRVGFRAGCKLLFGCVFPACLKEAGGAPPLYLIGLPSVRLCVNRQTMSDADGSALYEVIVPNQPPPPPIPAAAADSAIQAMYETTEAPARPASLAAAQPHNGGAAEDDDNIYETADSQSKRVSVLMAAPAPAAAAAVPGDDIEAVYETSDGPSRRATISAGPEVVYGVAVAAATPASPGCCGSSLAAAAAAAMMVAAPLSAASAASTDLRRQVAEHGGLLFNHKDVAVPAAPGIFYRESILEGWLEKMPATLKKGAWRKRYFKLCINLSTVPNDPPFTLDYFKKKDDAKVKVRYGTRWGLIQFSLGQACRLADPRGARARLAARAPSRCSTAPSPSRTSLTTTRTSLRSSAAPPPTPWCVRGADTRKRLWAAQG